MKRGPKVLALGTLFVLMYTNGSTKFCVLYDEFIRFCLKKVLRTGSNPCEVGIFQQRIIYIIRSFPKMAGSQGFEPR